jgi:hypothetical protein
MSELTNNDFKQILEYYKKPIPKSKRLLKIAAEKILTSKLCRCIKKIDPINEAKSIGICTKTIFNNKGYTRGKFSCKKNGTLKIKKSRKNITKRRK